MKILIVLFVLHSLANVAFAQYAYPKPKITTTIPPPPPAVYLPPSTAPPTTTTTRKPYEAEEQIDAEGISGDRHGNPYELSYAVKDDPTNSDFSYNAVSDGDKIEGEYRTLLPDGRLQIVKYVSDWKNGHRAEVTYEGEAVYPKTWTSYGTTRGKRAVPPTSPSFT